MVKKGSNQKNIGKKYKALSFVAHPPPLHLTKSSRYPQTDIHPNKNHRLRGVVAVPETWVVKNGWRMEAGVSLGGPHLCRINLEDMPIR